jgi:peptidoglycan L-alanyl-D-glutamate endopeptidase CwlK
MAFKLSQRSLDRLDGVKPQLIELVKRAIEITTIDFGVIEGLRSEERQKELVAKGASKTMKSKHLDGNAVDLMAYLDGKACWEIPVYEPIADAMKTAAIECGTEIRWGGAWSVSNLEDWDGTAGEAMDSYIDLRRSQGKKIFLDCPHFELV